MTSSDNHRLLYRGWRRLCLNAASSTDAGGDSAAATPHARSARAKAMEREAADIAGNAASRETTAASRRDGVFTAVAQGPEARRYGKGGRLDTVQQERQFAARQVSTLSVSNDI